MARRNYYYLLKDSRVWVELDNLGDQPYTHYSNSIGTIHKLVQHNHWVPVSSAERAALPFQPGDLVQGWLFEA